MIIPVILSGGSGSRLWPLSREAHPKQFLPLASQQSLFQDTLLRLDGIPECHEPLVICNESHRFTVLEQARNIEHDIIGPMLEPVGRNTAPAIACAALFNISHGMENSVLLVMPSDHVIRDTKKFQRCVLAGEQTASAGHLVTFGVTADRPETGYGYIKRSTQSLPESTAYPVAQFIEKPDSQTAQQFLDSGDYYWNSGIFMFRAGDYLEVLAQHRPNILAACKLAVSKLQLDNTFLRLDKEAFASCPGESIDYAVMEKTDKAAVIPMQAGWSDLGAWSALSDIANKDDAGNYTHGDTLLKDARNNYIHSSKRLISAIGVHDTIIVETADAVLVAHNDRSQDIKDIVDQLKSDNREEAVFHTRIYRPWGNFETIDEGPGYKVKRIVVKPGGCLSLQMHHKRAEHWVVVSGLAKVTKDDDEFMLEADQSTYIPIGTRHRLENEGVEPLEIIEVQTGGYLGEDDIVRFSDQYGRDSNSA